MVTKSNSFRNAILSICISAISLSILLVLAEVIIRVKNRATDNYDIEMWRYAKILKRRSANSLLSHEHVPSVKARLQSVDIRINEFGLRGPSISPTSHAKRRILFLGSSVTMGWGVPENETTPQRLEALFKERGEDVEVLNAGIGNYNTERYVELFFSKLKVLNPTDIVVHFFLRDGEALEQGSDGWLIRHSELAALLWMSTQQLLSRVNGKSDLLQHYQAAYASNAPGFIATTAAIRRLAAYAHTKNINIYLALIPEMRRLQNYPFGFVHERMHEVAKANNIEFIDLYPHLSGLSPQEIWVLPVDPHPNSLGHQRMAESILSRLIKTAAAVEVVR